MNRNSFSVFFFIKKTKLLSNGEAPIRLRIKVNGVVVESQIKRSISPNLWEQSTESSKGRDRKSAELNEYIRMLKLKVLTIHRELELSGVASGNYTMSCTVEGMKIYPDYCGLEMIIAVAFQSSV